MVGYIDAGYLKSVIMLFKAVNDIPYKDRIQIIIVGSSEHLPYLMQLSKTLSLDVVYQVTYLLSANH